MSNDPGATTLNDLSGESRLETVRTQTFLSQVRGVVDMHLSIAGRLVRVVNSPYYSPQVLADSPRFFIATGGNDAHPDVGWCTATGSWLVAFERGELDRPEVHVLRGIAGEGSRRASCSWPHFALQMSG